jgi:hypothetical protein
MNLREKLEERLAVFAPIRRDDLQLVGRAAFP